MRNIEFFGLTGSDDESSQLFDLNPSEFRQAVNDAGLVIPLSHFSRTSSLTDAPAIADLAGELGIEILVAGSTRGPYLDNQSDVSDMRPIGDLSQLDRFADELNEFGRAFQDFGMTLAYHPYDVDFTAANDRIPFDYLMERTDRDLVKIELDSAWLSVAGMDPVGYLRRYSDRVIAYHLKDIDGAVPLSSDPVFWEFIESGAFVEPGAGRLDFSRILQVIEEVGVQYPLIDVEVSDDALAQIDRAFHYLQDLTAC
jgi:sugar phosphate isomerase/epimerase